jgi:hypothetical protein
MIPSGKSDPQVSNQTIYAAKKKKSTCSILVRNMAHIGGGSVSRVVASASSVASTWRSQRRITNDREYFMASWLPTDNAENGDNDRRPSDVFIMHSISNSGPRTDAAASKRVASTDGASGLRINARRRFERTPGSTSKYHLRRPLVGVRACVRVWRPTTLACARDDVVRAVGVAFFNEELSSEFYRQNTYSSD